MTILFLDLETTGLGAYQDRITCIGYCLFNTETKEEKYDCIFNEDESMLLADFLQVVIRDKKPDKIIAWNGNNFDFPFIKTRVMKNDLLQMYEKEVGYPIEEDCRELFPESSFPPPEWSREKYGNKAQRQKRRPSLTEAADFLNIKEQKNGTGPEAIMLFDQKKFKELQEYCIQDVRVLVAIWKKLNGVKE